MQSAAEAIKQAAESAKSMATGAHAPRVATTVTRRASVVRPPLLYSSYCHSVISSRRGVGQR